MITKFILDTSRKVSLTRPLSYEYDTDTESVVLLDGYEYTVVYKRSSRNLAQTIDLRVPTSGSSCSIENQRSIRFSDDFYYNSGLVWTISVDGTYVGEADGDDSYLEDFLEPPLGLSSRYASSNLYINNISETPKTITLVPSDPSRVNFSGIFISNPGNFSIDPNGVVTICLGITGEPDGEEEMS